MQSSWRDNNDRILDKVGRLRRVGFLLFPSATVWFQNQVKFPLLKGEDREEMKWTS